MNDSRPETLSIDCSFSVRRAPGGRAPGLAPFRSERVHLQIRCRKLDKPNHHNDTSHDRQFDTRTQLIGYNWIPCVPDTRQLARRDVMYSYRITYTVTELPSYLHGTYHERLKMVNSRILHIAALTVGCWGAAAALGCGRAASCIISFIHSSGARRTEGQAVALRMALAGGVSTALDITAHFPAGGGRSQSLAANGNRHLPVGRRLSHPLQDPTSHFCTAFPSNQRGLSYNTEKTSMCFGSTTVIDLNPDVKAFSGFHSLPGDCSQDRPRSRLTRMHASKRKKTKRHNSNPNFGNEPDASLNGRATPGGRGSRANSPNDSELSQPNADPQMNIREAVLQLKTQQQNLRLVSDEPSTRPAWEVGAPSLRNGSSNSITLIQRTIRGGQTEDHPGTIVVSSGFLHSLSPNV